MTLLIGFKMNINKMLSLNRSSTPTASQQSIGSINDSSTLPGTPINIITPSTRFTIKKVNENELRSASTSTLTNTSTASTTHLNTSTPNTSVSTPGVKQTTVDDTSVIQPVMPSTSSSPPLQQKLIQAGDAIINSEMTVSTNTETTALVTSTSTTEQIGGTTTMAEAAATVAAVATEAAAADAAAGTVKRKKFVVRKVETNELLGEAMKAAATTSTVVAEVTAATAGAANVAPVVLDASQQVATGSPALNDDRQATQVPPAQHMPIGSQQSLDVSQKTDAINQKSNYFSLSYLFFVFSNFSNDR